MLINVEIDVDFSTKIIKEEKLCKKNNKDDVHIRTPTLICDPVLSPTKQAQSQVPS